VGRFRFGLLAGLAIGYVLGTKAGRERYLQLQRTVRQAERIWRKVSSSPTATAVARKTGSALGNGLAKGKMATASKIPWVRDRVGNHQAASSF
jgi:hypothetical protein